MKILKEEKEQLALQKAAQLDTYNYFKEYHKELRIVCSNVDSILKQPHTRKQEQKKSKDISQK